MASGLLPSLPQRRPIEYYRAVAHVVCCRRGSPGPDAEDVRSQHRVTHMITCYDDAYSPPEGLFTVGEEEQARST